MTAEDPCSDGQPGPHDVTYFFDCFLDMIRNGKAPTADEMAIGQAADVLASL